MKKTIKIILSIMLIFVIFCSIINNISNAALYDADALNVLSESADSYKPSGETSTETQNMVNNILGIITIVGATVSVVLIAIIGFNYILGSAQEKAANKEQLITFTIGAILLTCGTVIVKVIYGVASSW